MTFTTMDLVEATGGRWISGDRSRTFSTLSIDTRTIKKGDLFVALRGPRFDGHAFIRKAIDLGAGGVVVQRGLTPADRGDDSSTGVLQVDESLLAIQNLARFARKRSTAAIIGLTGSNGKTSTKEMLASILAQAGPTLATKGNFNNQIGLPLTLCELQPKHRFAVIEMGTSHPGDMVLLANLANATAGLITNVGRDHLAFFGTPEGVLLENRILVDQLPPEGVAVINLDDPLLAPLSKTLKCRTVSYSASAAADVSVGSFSIGDTSIALALKIDGATIPVTLDGPDALQIRNAVAAAATAFALNIPTAAIAEGLRQFKPASMRLQRHTHEGGAILINDAYNANPSSVKASIESFCQSYPSRRRWVVLGDMRELGTLAREEHHDLGRWLAHQPIDRAYLYGRDTRFIESELRSAAARTTVERFKKKRTLIDSLRQALSSEKPAVLFKASRSMKLEDVVNALRGQTSAAGH